MRRWKNVLIGLGILALLGVFAAMRAGRAHRQVWAQTLSEVAEERTALFALRDEVGVDAARQQRLADWAKRFLQARISPHDDWDAQTLRKTPVVSESVRPFVESVAPFARELDEILASGPVHLSGWVYVDPNDSADQMLRVPSAASHLIEIASYWKIVGLTAADPEPALDALDRIVAPSLLPRGTLSLWFVTGACAWHRDALHLGLLMRGRLPPSRLDDWLAEQVEVRALLADAVRVDRAFVVGPRLERTLREDRGAKNLTQAPRRSARRWWYARNKGPRDANRVIQDSVAWERYFRGLAEPPSEPPPADEPRGHKKRRHRYFREHAINGALSSGLALNMATFHRNARLFGAALATLSPGDPLWKDDAAFRRALGDQAEKLAGRVGVLPCVYELGKDERTARLRVPPDADLPSYLEPNRKWYCASPWQKGDGASVRSNNGSFEIRLPK